MPTNKQDITQHFHFSHNYTVSFVSFKAKKEMLCHATHLTETFPVNTAKDVSNFIQQQAAADGEKKRRHKS